MTTLTGAPSTAEFRKSEYFSGLLDMGCDFISDDLFKGEMIAFQVYHPKSGPVQARYELKAANGKTRWFDKSRVKRV